METHSHIKTHIIEITNLLQTVHSELADVIEQAVDLISEVFEKGNKLLIAGNGGSAADAQHIAAELIVRLTAESNRPSLPAIALTTDTSILTAAANDFGFDQIFKRQLEGLANKNDCFLAISTSGNSANLVEALKYCNEKKIKSIGLLGNQGGKMKDLVDIPIIVKSNNTMHIQETHMSVYHLICDLVERSLY